jgi:hypothetical protein
MMDMKDRLLSPADAYDRGYSHGRRHERELMMLITTIACGRAGITRAQMTAIREQIDAVIVEDELRDAMTNAKRIA